MSTELLTRRMDLIHTSTLAINTLKMDTSYPVKLSGIVIKVFQAVSDYTNIDPETETEFSEYTNLFFVQNQAGSPVVTIQKQNVFDFAGNKLKNKEYITGDYVLAIIDINNAKIFIHSIQAGSRSDSIYTKDMDYHCNGINDNTILGGITNILIDLYDYSQDINYDQDEFTYDITNSKRHEIFPNDKFTINIIGKFGIDYSATDFHMGYFNRQNRSTIMKISGTSTTRSNNIFKNDDKDLELIMNWKRCTVPKIKYDSNEIYAAMFNAKLKDKVNNNVVYYDYWTEENTAHFVDNNGTPYGNLLPRRLMFMSIEGCLPINITCEYLSLETFGVGIYCETESNKCITLNDCKISILDNNRFCNDLFVTGDIKTNSAFYDKGAPIYLGSAIDINAFNPSVKINNCKIKNSNGNRDSNLIINSCSNMMINNSVVEDFYDMNDGYKFGFTATCMDYEYYPGYTHTEHNYTIDNVSTICETLNINLDNPNSMDMFIYTYLFKTNNAMFDGEYSLVPNKYILSSIINNYSDFTDLLGPGKKCTLENNTFEYTKSLITSSFSHAGFTFGAIKNIPVLWKDNLNQSQINASKEFMGLKVNGNLNPMNNYSSYTHDFFGNVDAPTNNGETVFMPKLFINMSKILCAGILYQLHSSTYISNSILKSKMFDSKYGCNPINLISGELTLNNCDCLYDSSIFKLNTVNTMSNGLSNMTFIKIYNPINKWDYTSSLGGSFDNYYFESDPYLLNNPATHPINSPKLNIVSTTITLIPDKSFNFIPSINNNECITFIPGYTVAGNVVSYNNATLSFILCDNNTSNNNLFNPLINPYINISDSEFKIADNASTGEIYSMGNSEQSSDPLYINNTYGVIVKKGSNIYSSSGTIINNMSNYLTTMPDMTADFNYDNYSHYLNVQKEVKSDGVTFYSGSNILYSVTIQDINSGIIYRFDKYNNGSFAWNTVKTVDLSDYSNIFSKIDVLEMDHYLDFWYTLAKLNNDTECTFDSISHQVKYTKSDSTIVNMIDEDPEDHIFICKMYGSDLAHSGYYIHENFTNSNDYSQFNKFGVVGFKLKNCNLSMSNCKIGGSNHNSMRNSYNMELFTRRSPRICFDFEDSGIYKISNTDASSWATVLWSQLNKDSITKKVSNIDYTSIDLNNNGMCTIQNCNFINYNALRFKQTSEDWIDTSNYPINDTNLNINILDKGTLTGDIINRTSDRNNSVNNQVFRCISESVRGELLTDPFNESIRNANEMPIIFIMNTDNNIVKIINSDIKGNETVIISGNVQFNNTKYLNNSNGMMCYVKSNSTPASLDINNCQIILNKDVIYDRYIDTNRLRDINTNISYEEVCDDKGMNKYNGNIRGIILDSKTLFRFDNNNVVFKSNDFYHLYGINEDTEISLIYVDNNYTGEDANDTINIESFTQNKIISIFDCPIMNNKMDDSDSSIINCRRIPDSKNMSIISVYNNNANISNPKQTIVSKKSSCILNIKDNEFNNITIVNENDNYYIPVYIKDNEDNIGLPIFRPLNQNRLCAKYNYLHVYPNEEGDETVLGSDTIIVLEEQNRTRDMNIENLSEQCYSDSILRSIYSFDNFTNPYESKKYFNDSIISKSINSVTGNTVATDSTSKLKVQLYLDNNKLTPGMFVGTNPVVYTGFNTPIIYSNIYIPINIQGNTFINSTNESLDNLYNLYNDQKVSVIRSATIVDINQPNISADMPTETDINQPIINNKIIIKDNIFTNNNSKNMTLNMTDFINGNDYITTTSNNDQYGYINIKTGNSRPKYSFDNTLGLTDVYSDIIRCPHISNKYSKYNSVTDTKGYSIKLNNDINLAHDTYFNTVKMYLNMTNSDNKLIELHPTSDCDNIGFYYPNKTFKFDTLNVATCVKIARGFDNKYILIHSVDSNDNIDTNYMIRSQDLKCIDNFIGMKESQCIKIVINQTTTNVIYQYDEINDEFIAQNMPASTWFISSYDFKLRSENGTDLIYFEIRSNTRSHTKYYCDFAQFLAISNKSITYPTDISNILMGPLNTYITNNNTYTLSLSNTTNIRLFKMENNNINADTFLLNEYILAINPEDDSVIRLPKKYSIIITSGKEYTRTAKYEPIPISDVENEDYIYLFKCPYYNDSSLTSRGTSSLVGLYVISEVHPIYLKIRLSGHSNIYYITNDDYINYSYNLIKKIFNDSLYNTYLFDTIHTSLLPNINIDTFDNKDYSSNYTQHLNSNLSNESIINDPLDHTLFNAPILNINIDTINNTCVSPTIDNISYDNINTKPVLSKYICPDINMSNR